MVKLKINNIDFDVPQGSTIMEVATDAGFSIPSLCHNKNLPHYSSCMVCLVKDKRTGSFIPSCTALVQNGMDIDISSEEVISLRRKAIGLLLSEHRAECEAPCRIVCPAGYNIPLMNRYLQEQDLNSAIHLAVSEQNGNEIHCINCSGYCENACRRKKVDMPVSIRNIQLFVFRYLKGPDYDLIRDSLINESNGAVIQAVSPDNVKKRFTSHIGKLEVSELKEWLRECSDDLIRIREIEDLTSAYNESGSCMHCDCRATADCKLRIMAEEFSIKDPRGKLVISPIRKKINKITGLIFENAKCIKCGLCVRICEKSNIEPSLCFINRGFVSIISEPLTEEFDNILLKDSKKVIDICPTGALSQLK